MDHRVAIVGGGLAGLFTASELLAAGIEDVVVLDRDRAPGGVARTIRRGGYTLEPAAGTLLLPHPSLSQVVGHLGVALTAAVDAGKRYVFTGGRLVAVPSSPRVMLAPLVPWRARLRAAREPLIRTPPAGGDESLDGFLRRRLGEDVGSLASWVAASGVFAGDPARLSARSAFPAFPAMEAAAGSMVAGGLARLRRRPTGVVRPVPYIPVDGMSALADAAAGKLGDRYRPGRMVGAVRRSGAAWKVEGSEPVRAEHVVMACGPGDAGPLLGGELGSILARASSAPVVVVWLGGAAGGFPLPAGFGALTGPKADVTALGVLFESSYAPARAPEGHSLVKVIAGGATRPGLVDRDDRELVDRLGHDVSRVLGRQVEASFVEVMRHRPGIPQYEVGHAAWLAEVGRLLPPGLHLTGWGYRGVGVAHVAADAVATARRITGS
jgi:oxygen-dependent protoporphyrinogen oxidase